MLQLSLLSQKNVSFALCETLKLVVTALVFVTIAQSKATEEVIKNLTSRGAEVGLIFDQKGNLYGSTSGIFVFNGVGRFVRHDRIRWRIRGRRRFRGHS